MNYYPITRGATGKVIECEYLAGNETWAKLKRPDKPNPITVKLTSIAPIITG